MDRRNHAPRWQDGWKILATMTEYADESKARCSCARHLPACHKCTALFVVNSVKLHLTAYNKFHFCDIKLHFKCKSHAVRDKLGTHRELSQVDETKCSYVVWEKVAVPSRVTLPAELSHLPKTSSWSQWRRLVINFFKEMLSEKLACQEQFRGRVVSCTQDHKVGLRRQGCVMVSTCSRLWIRRSIRRLKGQWFESWSLHGSFTIVSLPRTFTPLWLSWPRCINGNQWTVKATCDDCYEWHKECCGLLKIVLKPYNSRSHGQFYIMEIAKLNSFSMTIISKNGTKACKSALS